MRSLIPWRYLVRRWAKARGFLDPILLLAQVSKFSQKSEVLAPLELLRAGFLLQARGLINSQAIQHNLDWVWPYWVVRQFDPEDNSFVPRAFDFTHINITHRNWTAVGLPDFGELPIIDPRGLVTPFLDSWSVDVWVVDEHGHELIPSKLSDAAQKLVFNEAADKLSVETRCRIGHLSLSSTVYVSRRTSGVCCRVDVKAFSQSRGWVVIALRPYNPDGVSLIHDIEDLPDAPGWSVDHRHMIRFGEVPAVSGMSNYSSGDVHRGIGRLEARAKIHCDVGMATAGALFKIEPGVDRRLSFEIPLSGKESDPAGGADLVDGEWAKASASTARLSGGDAKFRFLYDTAIRTLILHSPDDVYPGPSTYRRFWFRDAAFIIHAMLCAGLVDRAERVIDNFFWRQSLSGHFLSQDGEWDSNGEALWIMKRFCDLTGRLPKRAWRTHTLRAARWIARKRTPSFPDSPHAGLLPAGFSAEHFGPNDYYYWDNFWSLAGLLAAKEMALAWGDRCEALEFEKTAKSLQRDLELSLTRSAERLGTQAIPASPYRRLDAACIGSLIALYPLNIMTADDPRMLETVQILIERHFLHGAFFHDISHSGINIYLTLHVAQALLRAGDARFFDAVKAAADLASPTGQWPEAIHPRTGGGCMGDGQHVWASAEWVQIVRDSFIREDSGSNRLVLCSGLVSEWFDAGSELEFGPCMTDEGPVSVAVRKEGERAFVSWKAVWRRRAPVIEIRLPGFAPIVVDPGMSSAVLTAEASWTST